MTRLARRGLSLVALIFGLSVVSALAVRAVLQLWTNPPITRAHDAAPQAVLKLTAKR
jgi:hypothetical protein